MSRRVRLPLRELRCCVSIAILTATSGCAADAGGLRTSPEGMYRADGAHTGVVATRGPERYGGIQWSHLTEGPVRSTPLIVDSTVYVGSSDGGLYSLALGSGELRWRFEAESAVNSSPAADGERVYFASQDGTVFALHRRTGEVMWRVTGERAVPLAWGRENGDFYLSSPTLANGLVLVGLADGYLYALEPESGRVRWRMRSGGRIRTSPAVSDSLVVVASFDGVIYAADIGTGAIVWRHATEGATLDAQQFGFDRRSIQSSPAIAEGTVYVGSRDGHLYALNLADGALRWRRPYDMSWVIGAPAVTADAVFASTSDARYVHALDPRTGDESWRFGTTRASWSSPSVDSNTVYVGESGGQVYALDRRTGTERWRFASGGSVFSSPAVGDGVLVFGSNDGRVYALRGGGIPLARVVYADSALARRALDGDRPWIARGLGERGYEVVDGPGLGEFLRARITDGQPSVVVIATGELPSEVTAGGDPLLRRYLRAGGKVVWIGTPPLIWPADSSGGREYRMIDPTATTRLLGVDHGTANFDRYRAAPTAEGSRWGLRGWDVARWAIKPAPAVTPLMIDENGKAAAWVRSYGGAPGTGFVRLDEVLDNAAALDELRVVAEYRPR